ncbi:MAG: 3-hydroxyacyl-CoA dehydrogenase NAD-binding domain-containing protein [Planctomycetaceae bacterium]
MSELVSLTKHGDIGVITVNNPPVNALSPGVPEGIGETLTTLQADPAVKAIVLMGGGRTFIAGADIKEFGKMTSGQKRRNAGLHPLLEALEDCPKPVVAAIHGTALGGGMEVALACHYRVAVPAAQVGQPEVKLGLIPGAGGTQRLPLLAGVALAAQMCAGGEPIKAQEALRAGILDRIIEGDLLEGAIGFAREVAAAGKPPRRTREQTAKLADAQANAAALQAVRAAIQKKTRGLLAPSSALDAIEAAWTLPFDEGCRREAELFEQCLYSKQSQALIHVFFSERGAAKVPGISPDLPKIPIRRAAVVGAGTMGGGIAMTYANAGIPVLLKEIDQESLDRGMAVIRRNYGASLKRGRLTQEQHDQRLALIEPTVTFERFREVDIVVEAVFEGMELKRQVFTELDRVTREDAILASNTSTLDIDAIASATSRPQQVIGHHFFSPANVMRLLEIVRGQRTGSEVIATSLALAKTLGKVGVLVGNCRGFVGNRMFGPYQRESQFLLEEGARVDEVDSALVGFGMAMGPLTVGDLAGLDVGWRIRKEYRHLTPQGVRVPLAADRLCEMGRFGQKTGAGWYRYSDRVPSPDPDVERLIEECARTAGIARRKIPGDEIVERTVYALINEGARILDEGFALRAADIDIIYIHGYGFPAFRGGPMWHADQVGLPKILDRIRQFERQHGSLWAPAALLSRLAEAGKSFTDFDKEKAGA